MLTKEQECKLNVLCKRAFESLVGQIIIDEEGTILFFSKEHVKFMGIPREDAEGKKVWDVIPNTKMHMIVKTGIPEIGKIFEMKNMNTGEKKLMVCNRIPIRDEKGKIIGAMAETIFSRGVDDVHRLGIEIREHSDINKFTTETDYYKDIFNTSANEVKTVCESNVNNIKGTSAKTLELKHLIARVANMPLPVLITGETGTGKEVFAEALHIGNDIRHSKNFVKINCAAIPSELLESELFGYEKGAFSGANREGKMGKFEYAGSGTVLLDEIGDMPMDLQGKLLRVLQEKEFERVGGLKSIPFNARIICTTNKDVQKLVEEGKFREDLYYRINVLEFKIPPLRERIDDIVELGQTFIHKINLDYDLDIRGVDEEALEMLKHYSWPGNVREFRHVIERACLMKGQGVLSLEDFSFLNSALSDKQKERLSVHGSYNLRDVREKAEKEAILGALEETGGNRTSAAKLLGIDRTILYDKIKRYGIDA